ncbi:MAG: GNAT family N-acetyltransferase [Bacillaceae bacterium]|nr:GNAT family N-acetyltransferase [Bacillaceae bacterium]
MNVIEVELKRYEKKYFKILKNFTLPAEQEQFTALPIELLRENLEEKHDQHGIVILSDHEPVGFFVLHSSDRVKEYTDNPNAMLLAALSINYSQQGKGFAQKGMKQLKSFIKKEFPACNEVVLAVNHKNIPAQQLYKKVGFKDTGRRKIGKIGEQLILSLTV